jgi:beta-phosphoglucomutase-like phosphatase (HAD superfamily)
MTLVKAVFLDIDGTLMDTNYLHIEAWAQAFEEVGVRPPSSSIHHEVGKGSDKLIPEFLVARLNTTASTKLADDSSAKSSWRLSVQRSY